MDWHTLITVTVVACENARLTDHDYVNFSKECEHAWEHNSIKN